MLIFPEKLKKVSVGVHNTYTSRQKENVCYFKKKYVKFNTMKLQKENYKQKQGHRFLKEGCI